MYADIVEFIRVHLKAGFLSFKINNFFINFRSPDIRKESEKQDQPERESDG